jgi:hypothetical protein
MGRLLFPPRGSRSAESLQFVSRQKAIACVALNISMFFAGFTKFGGRRPLRSPNLNMPETVSRTRFAVTCFVRPSLRCSFDTVARVTESALIFPISRNG